MAFLILLAFQVIAWLNFWELVDVAEPAAAVALRRCTDPHEHATSPAARPSGSRMLVAIPALTMRLVAEERRSGTIETLLTVPVTETEVVVAKWLAGVVMYLRPAPAVRDLSPVPLLPGAGSTSTSGR